jgi:glycerate kinase
MRLVVAPDSFKGSATAAAIAAAVADGWREVRPDDDVEERPMADGGEGTVDAIIAAQPLARRVPVTVVGPDDQAVVTEYLLLPDGSAVVEVANTSGLALTSRERPLQAHTRGFGQAIAAALGGGADRLLLALGGSGSTDGGTGMLSELGARFLAADGTPVGSGGGALVTLHRVELAQLRPLPPGGVQILSDVTAPLLGGAGAARLFGPQKGADGDDVAKLEHGLQRLADCVGLDPSIPGAGAAGGTGYALLAWGGQVTSGAAAVADAIGLPALIATADLVVTGEGRFDGQSELGKVPTYVRRLAADRGRPAFLVAGLIDAEPAGFLAAVSLVQLAGSAAASLAEPIRHARAAGAVLARAVG